MCNFLGQKTVHWIFGCSWFGCRNLYSVCKCALCVCRGINGYGNSAITRYVLGKSKCGI